MNNYSNPVRKGTLFWYSPLDIYEFIAKVSASYDVAHFHATAVKQLLHYQNQGFVLLAIRKNKYNNKKPQE